MALNTKLLHIVVGLSNMHKNLEVDHPEKKLINMTTVIKLVSGGVAKGMGRV